eukprot:COSAG01_NODE_10096_length_2251_cov_21.436338_2_plen_172_part_00
MPEGGRAGWLRMNTGISPSPPRHRFFSAPSALSEEVVPPLLHEDAFMMRRARHSLATAPQSYGAGAGAGGLAEPEAEAGLTELGRFELHADALGAFPRRSETLPSSCERLTEIPLRVHHLLLLRLHHLHHPRAPTLPTVCCLCGRDGVAGPRCDPSGGQKLAITEFLRRAG